MTDLSMVTGVLPSGLDHQSNSNPILDIAARFWDVDRYDAFKTCYKSMRIIDDLVDDRKSGTGIPESDRSLLLAIINDWVDGVMTSTPHSVNQGELVKTITEFQIPLWPWKRFSESMIFDLQNEGFKTLEAFLSYAEGASIAPASIGMHLCGVVKENGTYRRPSFDVKVVAEPFALFYYFVHIIRDFQEDQKKNLNYFAHDLLEENEVSSEMLREVARGGKISLGFRRLMERYYTIAEYYRGEAVQMLNEIRSYLRPRYQLSLEVTYNLYLQIFERINVKHGDFTTAELNPTPYEVSQRVQATLSSFRSRYQDAEDPLVSGEVPWG